MSEEFGSITEEFLRVTESSREFEKEFDRERYKRCLDY